MTAGKLLVILLLFIVLSLVTYLIFNLSILLAQAYTFFVLIYIFYNLFIGFHTIYRRQDIDLGLGMVFYISLESTILKLVTTFSVALILSLFIFASAVLFELKFVKLITVYKVSRPRLRVTQFLFDKVFLVWYNDPGFTSLHPLLEFVNESDTSTNSRPNHNESDTSASTSSRPNHNESDTSASTSSRPNASSESQSHNSATTTIQAHASELQNRGRQSGNHNADEPQTLTHESQPGSETVYRIIFDGRRTNSSPSTSNESANNLFVYESLRHYYKSLVDDYYLGLRAFFSNSDHRDCPYQAMISGYEYVCLPVVGSERGRGRSGTTSNNQHSPTNMPKIVTLRGPSYDAVKNLRIRLKKSCVLGLDCEWKQETRRGERNKIALLQLAAADGYCVIYRLSKLGQVPHDVKELLTDPSVIKTGVGIANDVRRLSKDYGVECKPFLDLRFMAIKLGHEPRSLKILSERHLGRELPSTTHQHISWERPELSRIQIDYAANDVWASVDLFVVFSYQMFERRGIRGENWVNNLSGTLEIFNDSMNKDFCYNRWRQALESGTRYP